tara:strand:+ start:2893 stop:3333 length:441 start_codon:yes stop_codon:yes gene_type:complete
MKLVRIPTSNIDEVWPLVKKDIADALVFSGNHTDAQFVFDTLKQDKFQLFIVWDKNQKTTLEKYYGVVVTEIVEKKLTKACHIFIMTGRQRQKWTALIKVIEDFAEQNNCDLLELIARPGWQRILKDYNYKRTHVVLEKPIIKKEK